jgi:Zn-dependent metalloprotease
MKHLCTINCIIPPHMLKKLMESADPEVRRIALETLLATTQLRTERRFAGFALAGRVGTNKDRVIFDCRNAENPQSALKARDEKASAAGDRSVDGAFDRFGATYDFFFNVFRRNSIDAQGMQLKGFVHYGKHYNNAFWNGSEMIFGDGDGRFFTDLTGSLDVIAHELTHGVTQFTAGLEYRNQSGALNESISDVFGSLVKQWSLKQKAQDADWLIGADIFTPAYKGDALRSMKDPGNAYHSRDFGDDPQPRHMSKYVTLPETRDGDWGGVHINSGIPNHAFYLAATAIGGYAWEVAGAIWFDALTQSAPATNFTAFADKTILLAASKYQGRKEVEAAVRDAWHRVGVGVTVPAMKKRVHH